MKVVHLHHVFYKDNIINSFHVGKIGSWKEEFSPELNRRADKWIQENLEHTDLRFPQHNNA
jgi:hypothetical protein